MLLKNVIFLRKRISWFFWWGIKNTKVLVSDMQKGRKKEENQNILLNSVLCDWEAGTVSSDVTCSRSWQQLHAEKINEKWTKKQFSLIERQEGKYKEKKSLFFVTGYLLVLIKLKIKIQGFACHNFIRQWDIWTGNRGSYLAWDQKHIRKVALFFISGLCALYLCAQSLPQNDFWIIRLLDCNRSLYPQDVTVFGAKLCS